MKTERMAGSNHRKWLAIMAIWGSVLIVVIALLAWGHLKVPRGDDNDDDDSTHTRIPIPFAKSWQPIEEADFSFSLPTISFTKGDHRLEARAYPELDQLARDLELHQKYRVVIVGHTRYSTDQDRRLAADRADSVRKYLAVSDAEEWILGTEAKAESSCRGVTFVVKQRK